MKISKVIIREPVRLGFFSTIENYREIDITSMEVTDAIRVFLNEYLKIYARKSGACRTPKQLGKFRSSLRFRTPYHIRWYIGEDSVELR